MNVPDAPHDATDAGYERTDPRARDADDGLRARRRSRRRAVLVAALLLGLAALAFAHWNSVPASLPDASRAPADARAALPERLLASTRRALGRAPRVGLQVGHWAAGSHPEELARFRWNTGGHADGLDEVDVNQEVAAALRDRLRNDGVRVDVLPAALPPGYRADVLLSIHADVSDDPSRRGYKSAHFRPARNRGEPELKSHVDAAFLSASGLPSDARNVTGNMLRYYAFDHRRYRHAAHRATPALIVELGYLSHGADRAYLGDPARPADALADGVLAFLRARGRW